MALFEEFEPRLVGSVLSGTASEHSDVNLHLFADRPEQVAFRLMRDEIPIDLASAACARARIDISSIPCTSSSRATCRSTPRLSARRAASGAVSADRRQAHPPCADVRSWQRCSPDGDASVESLGAASSRDQRRRNSFTRTDPAPRARSIVRSDSVEIRSRGRWITSTRPDRTCGGICRRGPPYPSSSAVR
jgi:hypothetical protein